MSIPKIVHICWDDKNVVDNQSTLILNGLKQVKDLNPDWTIQVSDKQDVEDYLKEKLDNLYSLYDNTHIVEKCDIWRLLKLYNEGGVYMDIDRFCNVSFSDIIKEDTKWVLPTCNDYDFSHDFMMSDVQNPVFIHTVNLILERRKAGIRDIYFLGPQTYMNSVSKMLCGVEVNPDPGLQTFSFLRKKIAEMPFVVTYRETSPYDTIIFRNKGNCYIDFKKAKREFYQSYGVEHWAQEW